MKFTTKSIAVVAVLGCGSIAYQHYTSKQAAWRAEVLTAYAACDALEVRKDTVNQQMKLEEEVSDADFADFQRSTDSTAEGAFRAYQYRSDIRSARLKARIGAMWAEDFRVNKAAWDCRSANDAKYGRKAFDKARRG